LPDNSDHIKPGSWRGNVQVKLVSLQTSWRRERQLAQKDCPFVLPILDGLEKEGADILSPKGTILVNSPLSVDDVDESLDSFVFKEASGDSDTSQIFPESRVDVENALVEAALEDADVVQNFRQPFDRKVMVNGKELAKSRALAQYSKYRKQVGSTDRLKQVQGIDRYAQNTSAVSNIPSINNPLSPDAPVLMISDPISTLLNCDNRAWLCIGEVNGLRVDGQYAECVPHEILQEKTVMVSYQLLGLRPATLDDDPSSLSDWRSCRIEEHSFTVPGQLIQPINPAISTHVPHSTFYLLDSQFLVALAASLLEYLSASDIKNIPKLAVSHTFPYREGSGIFQPCNASKQQSKILFLQAKHVSFVKTRKTFSTLDN
jgi:hypothetical protein